MERLHSRDEYISKTEKDMSLEEGFVGKEPHDRIDDIADQMETEPKEEEETSHDRDDDDLVVGRDWE
ncbi:hypothetical protein P9112_002603 [Eukaryota sp. TZLM1-RC]